MNIMASRKDRDALRAAVKEAEANRRVTLTWDGNDFLTSYAAEALRTADDLYPIPNLDPQAIENGHMPLKAGQVAVITPKPRLTLANLFVVLAIYAVGLFAGGFVGFLVGVNFRG